MKDKIKIKKLIIHIIALYILPIAIIAVCGFENERGIIGFLMSIVLMCIIIDDLNNVKV